jgi:hypothetical protein
LKKLLIYLHLGLLLHMNVGAWLLSVPLGGYVRYRASREMHTSSDLLRVTLHPEEYLRVGNHEIYYKSTLYDIVQESPQGQGIEFQLYEDILETYVKRIFDSTYHFSDTHSEKPSPLKTVVCKFLALEYITQPERNLALGAIPWAIDLRALDASQCPSSPWLQMPSPPPRS